MSDVKYVSLIDVIYSMLVTDKNTKGFIGVVVTKETNMYVVWDIRNDHGATIETAVAEVVIYYADRNKAIEIGVDRAKKFIDR
jgi:hypothetical protein